MVAGVGLAIADAIVIGIAIGIAGNALLDAVDPALVGAATWVGSNLLHPGSNVVFGKGDAQYLPREGEMPFIPKEGKTAEECWTGGKNPGFEDESGQLWQRDARHTGKSGRPHWDVQNKERNGYTRVNDSGDIIG